MPVPKPTTLLEYYKQKGQTLPTWQQRAPIFEKFGLGKAAEYEGTGPQNVQLLAALVKQDVPPTPAPAAPAAPKVSAFGVITDYKYGAPTTDELVAGTVPAPEIPAPIANAVTESFVTGLMTDLATKRKSFEDFLTSERERLDTERTQIQTNIQDFLAKQKDVLETDVKPLLQPWREELEKNERLRLKVEENYFANQRSTDELETLLTQIQEQVTAMKEVTGLAAIREPRIAKVKEDALARVGVIEAVMAARNNQITVATNLIDRSMVAINADKADQLTYYEAVFNFYETQKDEEGNRLIALEKKDVDFLNSQIDTIKKDMELAQASVDYIKGLMLDPNTADAVEQAGVKLTDSVEEIRKKFAEYGFKQDRIDKINVMEADGAKFMSLRSQWDTKPEAELIRIYDSRGNEMVFWKESKAEGIKAGASDERKAFEGTDWEYADEVISLNPTGTDDEIKDTLFRDTELGPSEINAKLASRISVSDVEFDAEDYVASFFKKIGWHGKEYEVEEAKKLAIEDLYKSETHYVSDLKRDIPLTDDLRNRYTAAINNLDTDTVVSVWDELYK